MELMLYVVPALIGAVVIAMAVKVIKRFLELRRAWSSGLTAEARCLRTYTTTSRSSDSGHTMTTVHHVYEFTPSGGRAVRFEEENGPATTVEGDFVTVHYTADRPEKATAHAPSPVKSAASTLGLLCFFGVMLAFCVFSMVTASDMIGSDIP
ncbi:DUF3592 domain-containing protein [Streptomyces sp. MZ04]|uniref:DUF3592 domain-containing protein n=1 Tax=Streptomyces sp. MZ04 TaxID=2559236 RepID=UPI00107EA576|nr:DUF3592 domain-containing protein [Streptomyces sp. MZ04]TGA86227.1 DUF3592 domain-containing protein [Streptomyces sp. MZ04]